MKKFTSLLILFVLMFSSFAVTSAASFSDTNDEAVEVIAGLGLVNGYEDGTFLPENTLTRAEFAQIIANLYSYGTDEVRAWKEIFFREESEDLELVVSFEKEKESIYSDVETNHWAYGPIMTVTELGLMTGMGNGEFHPESPVTLEQVYKVMICILGYNIRAVAKGGWPSGYRAVATELKLNSGVNSSGNALRGDVARIIYNAFDVEILQLDGVGESNTYHTIAGETFLTQEIGVTYVEGLMTDNGISDLEGVTNGYDMNITVGGRTLRLTEETQYLRDFLGRNVKVFYKYDDDNNTVVYGQLYGDEEIVTFDAKDFVDYTVSEIVYTDKNDNRKTLKLASGTKMIYNKTGLDTFSKSTFEVNKGTVSVVKTGSSGYDLIIVDAYTTFYVDSVDTVNKKLYSITTLYKNGILDLSDEDKNYTIYTEDGKTADFNYLSSGMILSISESDGYTGIYVSGTKVNGFMISDLYTENDIQLIGNGTDSYALSGDFIELKGLSGVKVGKTYTLYIDAFGEVVNIAEEKDGGVIAALMVGIKADGGLSDDVSMKYFTQEGEMKISYLADKVTFKNEAGVETSYKDASQIEGLMTNYSGLIRIGYDSNKDINYIELAGIQKAFDNDENRLVRLRISDTVEPTEKVTAYYKIHQGFEGKVIVSGNTKVFRYNPDMKEDDDQYAISNIGVFSNDARYEIFAYTTVADSHVADFIVYEDEVTKGIGPSNKTFALIKNIKKGLNDKGDPVNVITAFVNGPYETKLYCEDEVLNNIYDIWERTEVYEGDTYIGGKYKLEMGDIIRYSTLADGVTLDKIYLIFDENAINPHSGGQGHLAGSIGYFDSQDFTHSMPYAVTPAGDGFSSYSLYWAAEELRNVLFYPVLFRPGEIRLTSLDLSVNEYSDEKMGVNYALESYSTGPTNLFTVYVIDGNTIRAETTSINTYEIAGNECDRYFMSTRVGQTQNGFCIRGYTK